MFCIDHHRLGALGYVAPEILEDEIPKYNEATEVCALGYTFACILNFVDVDKDDPNEKFIFNQLG